MMATPLPPVPETRAERFESVTQAIQDCIDSAYKQRALYEVDSILYCMLDEHIDTLLNTKEELVKAFQKGEQHAS